MQVYADGTTALPDWEREASIKEFYGSNNLLIIQVNHGRLHMSVDEVVGILF